LDVLPRTGIIGGKRETEGADVTRIYFKDKRRRMYSGLTLLLLLPLLACTKPSPEKAAQEQLLRKIASLEVESEKLEGKIKEAGNDPGLRYNVVNEQELLKSRIERLKENLKQKEASH